MSQYRAYPAYKDSGVEWIGQVPEHWKVARVKRLASLRNERRNDVSTDTIYIGLEDVEAGSGQYKPTNGSSRQSEDSTVGIFYEGDVLYGKLRPYLRKAIISEMAGCCSTEFLVLRAEKTEPRWLQEWLLTPDVTHQIESGCEGAKMPRADWGHIGSIEVVYPDQPERAQILTTLDRETARIDALIEKKTRFIELLKEKRQALITHAVTKGLDPNVKMKDSGVEWIGQVPEHWKIAPVKYHYDARLGKMIQPAAVSDRDIEVPYHRAQTVQWERIVESDIKEMWASPRDIEQFSVSEGDLLICEGGDVCRAAIVKQPPEKNMIFQNSIHRIRSKGEYGVGWVMRLMQHLRSSEWIDVLCNKNTIVHFTSDKLGSLECPLPPPDEQATIVATLDRETVRIDALISKAEQSITLLKERRAAFITAAVTGQIDLRGKQ